MRRRLLDWILAGLLIVIPALVLRASLSARSPSRVDQAVLRVTAPLQAAVTWGANLVGGWWGKYVALINVEAENRELRAENEKLREKLAALSRRAVDIDALEALAALKQKSSADSLGARVIAAPMSPEFRVLRIRIDRGKSDVSVGMPVITAGGPVGRIIKVFGNYADVELVSDNAARTEVVIARTGGRGIMTGLGKTDSYACSIEWLERATNPEAAIKVGDEVVTSGLGATFPPGLLIGTVSKITGDDGMFQSVEVMPSVDVSRVRSVLVLLAPPPPPDPDAKNKKRSDAMFGARAL
ncbi:MAG TPA: rod shape-determining protein MreC [Kofleriaceae bacterium]|nr:rod shape-determining protein MreC [Kofleriaceae bacterium]